MKKFIFGLLTIMGMSASALAATEVDTDLVDELLEMIDNELTNLDQAQDQELVDAVTLLHSYEITKFDTVEGFMPDQAIRRDEAAKMYVNFQKNTLQENPEMTDTMCIFTDLHLGHSDLHELMQESCQRGLFKGHMGAFMPTDSITNAQAVIVLIRMIDGEKEEPTDDHYASNYMYAAENLGLLDDLGIVSRSMWDQPADRATIAKLLYRANLK